MNYFIEAFQPLAQFTDRMERFVSEIKSVPPAKGFDEIFYPGEMEARNGRVHRGKFLLNSDRSFNFILIYYNRLDSLGRIYN